MDDKQYDRKGYADGICNIGRDLKALVRAKQIRQADRRHKRRGQRRDQRAKAVFALFEQVCGRHPKRDHSERLVAPREVPPNDLESVVVDDREPRQSAADN